MRAGTGRFFEARAAAAYLRDEVFKLVAARRARAEGRRDILNLLLSARDPENGRAMRPCCAE